MWGADLIELPCWYSNSFLTNNHLCSLLCTLDFCSHTYWWYVSGIFLKIVTEKLLHPQIVDKQGRFSMFQDLWLWRSPRCWSWCFFCIVQTSGGGGGDVDPNSVNNRSINMPLSMPRFNTNETKDYLWKARNTNRYSHHHRQHLEYYELSC